MLAQLELSNTCEVVRCSPGVRKYAVPVKAGKTRVLSLVGDGDVAPGCPKVLHFHIADGLPERAQLYLRGGTISSLWYSELAKHNHDLNIVVDGGGLASSTSITAPRLDGETERAGAHRHAFWIDEANGKNDGGFESPNPYRQSQLGEDRSTTRTTRFAQRGSTAMP